MVNVKQNIDIICNLMKATLSRCNMEKNKAGNTPTRVSILCHRIFLAINEIVSTLERIEFQVAKELIGKSLREDYSLIE